MPSFEMTQYRNDYTLKFYRVIFLRPTPTIFVSEKLAQVLKEVAALCIST